MTTAAEAPTAAPTSRIFRIEVAMLPTEPDPLAVGTLADIQRALGPATAVTTARVFLIQAPIDDQAAARVANELLTDRITQTAHIGVAPLAVGAQTVEVHYQPGVMDPVAQSTLEAIAEMFAPAITSAQVEVRTGFRFDIAGLPADVTPEAIRKFAQTALANPVIQDIHLAPFLPERFPKGSAYTFRLTHVPMRELDDAALTKMSREAHLFLSLDEMRAIRDYYRAAEREPTDIELEMLAQTWSEHCVHKTLKATIKYTQAKSPAAPDATADGFASGFSPNNIAHRPYHVANEDGSITINNLLKSTVAAATFKLMEDPAIKAWCISVFKDNAGIIKFDDEFGVCIKVETHNHPSAIEPYGGAATGIGGCIRDVMGTGLSAKPIANSNVFCVAFPPTDGVAATLPKGVIPPKRTLQQVVAGVRDYGNRMGIPTVNGAVWFHHDYVANPLVFAGCIGLIPLDRCFGVVKPGDHIIALGGRTGRDGIHGATFSSAELTDTHADEFSHAVQIGNAITQKKTLDVILRARDFVPATDPTAAPRCLFNAITDCGAGGFSSAVGEMAQSTGAKVVLENAPLKYQGLSYTEVWISEAQERMVLAVPAENIATLKQLCDAEDVELCDLGTFGNTDANGQPELLLTYHGNNVGRLSMHLLHDGIPTPTRVAHWEPPVVTPRPQAPRTAESQSLPDVLLALLSHPNIASKHWIIRQYDHEVQGGSVVKPLTGPKQDGPGDAAVLRPRLNSNRGIAVGCGLQTGLGEKGDASNGDSYWMTLAAIDEAVRNVVCAGADPSQIAILDNFCWPRCDDPKQLGSLVRAAEACYDGALAYRTPFVSGKDSLSNQFTTEDGKLITIPPTLLITALGIVNNALRARTSDAKAAGNALLIVGQTDSRLGGSHYRAVTRDDSRDARIPHADLEAGPRNAKAIAALIADGLIASAHDCSDGGLLLAAAEMAFGGRIGLDVELDAVPTERQLDEVTASFAETPSRYLIEVEPQHLNAVALLLRHHRAPFAQVGRFNATDRLTVRSARHGRLLDLPLDLLVETWRKPLDW